MNNSKRVNLIFKNYIGVVTDTPETEIPDNLFKSDDISDLNQYLKTKGYIANINKTLVNSDEYIDFVIAYGETPGRSDFELISINKNAVVINPAPENLYLTKVHGYIQIKKIKVSGFEEYIENQFNKISKDGIMMKLDINKFKDAIDIVNNRKHMGLLLQSRRQSHKTIFMINSIIYSTTTTDKRPILVITKKNEESRLLISRIKDIITAINNEHKELIHTCKEIKSDKKYIMCLEINGVKIDILNIGKLYSLEEADGIYNMLSDNNYIAYQMMCTDAVPFIRNYYHFRKLVRNLNHDIFELVMASAKSEDLWFSNELFEYIDFYNHFMTHPLHVMLNRDSNYFEDADGWLKDQQLMMRNNSNLIYNEVYNNSSFSRKEIEYYVGQLVNPIDCDSMTWVIKTLKNKMFRNIDNVNVKSGEHIDDKVVKNNGMNKLCLLTIINAYIYGLDVNICTSAVMGKTILINNLKHFCDKYKLRYVDDVGCSKNISAIRIEGRLVQICPYKFDLVSANLNTDDKVHNLICTLKGTKNMEDYQRSMQFVEMDTKNVDLTSNFRLNILNGDIEFIKDAYPDKDKTPKSESKSDETKPKAIKKIPNHKIFTEFLKSNNPFDECKGIDYVSRYSEINKYLEINKCNILEVSKIFNPYTFISAKIVSMIPRLSDKILVVVSDSINILYDNIRNMINKNYTGSICYSEEFEKIIYINSARIVLISDKSKTIGVELITNVNSMMSVYADYEAYSFIKKTLNYNDEDLMIIDPLYLDSSDPDINKKLKNRYNQLFNRSSDISMYSPTISCFVNKDIKWINYYLDKYKGPIGKNMLFNKDIVLSSKLDIDLDYLGFKLFSYIKKLKKGKMKTSQHLIDFQEASDLDGIESRTIEYNDELSILANINIDIYDNRDVHIVFTSKSSYDKFKIDLISKFTLYGDFIKQPEDKFILNGCYLTLELITDIDNHYKELIFSKMNESGNTIYIIDPKDDVLINLVPKLSNNTVIKRLYYYNPKTIKHAVYREAILESEKSKCSRLKVGCVIYDESRDKIVSRGFNGPLATTIPCNGTDHMLNELGRCVKAVHAEQKALLNANIDVKGMTAIVTHEPCEQCIKLLLHAGIKKIHFLNKYDNKYNIELIPCSVEFEHIYEVTIK